MAALTLRVGAFLIVLGAIGYFGSDSRSVTAWIPAFFGVPLVLLGWLGAAESRRKLCMHIAVVVGLLGAVGAGMRGLPNAGALFSGKAALPMATACQLAMFVLCLVYVILCVRSFIAARKAA